MFEGPKQNRQMVLNIINHPDFKENKMYTNFMGKNMDAMMKAGKKKKAPKKKVPACRPHAHPR